MHIVTKNCYSVTSLYSFHRYWQRPPFPPCVQIVQPLTLDSQEMMHVYWI